MRFFYQKPEVEIVKSDIGCAILAGSLRETKGEGFDGGVGPSVGDGNEYSHDNGHGQGEGSTGNRANFSLWDE